MTPPIRFTWLNPHLDLQSVVAATVEPTNVAPPAAAGTSPAAAGTSSSAAADASSATPAASLPLEFENLVLGLPPSLAAAYTINPHMITGADEQLADMIVDGIVSQPDADAYLLACDNSGMLLGIMYAECNKLNEDAEILILIMDEFNALTSRGLENKTTAGFLEYTARS